PGFIRRIFMFFITIYYYLPSILNVYNRFPKDEDLKTLWLDVCGIKNSKPSHRICDNHFTEDSFNENGNLIMKAVPSLSLIKSINKPSDSSNGCKRKLSYDNSVLSESVKFIKNTDDISVNKPNQMEIIQNTTMITPPTPISKKVIMFPRYINDLSVENFKTPRRRQRNLSFVKNIYNEKLKTIHNLQKKNKRLITKVKTLKDLMKVLEKKNFISENASKLLQV
ncbi:hypothetical protein AGLY_010460, partial [Aphis glycines]